MTKDELMEDYFFHEGYCDYYEGIEYAECPWSFDTDGEYGWKNGWTYAKKEYLDNQSKKQ